ncbi:MAG: fused MFS/spermidine synthase [Marinibacterium sp.]
MTSNPSAAPLWLLILLQAGISAASLVVEIVAGRMIAPYVGMSLYSWTAIIAVVLAGFSVGHWWGGRLAGTESDSALRRAGWTMVAAALATAGAALILRGTAGPVLSLLTQPVAAILVLTTVTFFLPSLFAGVPAPILAVVAIRGRVRSERALGAMFAAGAIGAIAGTLLAGYLFISWLGSVVTLAVVAGFYAMAALVLLRLGRASTGAAALCLAGVALIGARAVTLPAVCDTESSYFCIRTVALSDDPADPVNLMVIDHLAHGISAKNQPRVMFTDHTAMLDALPRMRMGRTDFSSFHIGGGSYSVPRAWADRGVDEITVSEIDPQVTRTAVRDFWFDPASARIVHRDGRVALQQKTRTYDVIVGDAFTDIAVPAHLITAEFFALVAARLKPDGVFAMNLVDNVDRLRALSALVVTLRTAFPEVEVWTEARPPEPGERRVFVLLAGRDKSPVSQITTRSPDPIRFAPLDDRFVETLIARTRPRVLKDDYAPIDRLMGFDRVVD